MTAGNAAMRYLVVGANHRSSSAATRDRLFVAEAQVPAVLNRLRDFGLTQALLLSTCARTEIQAAHTDPTGAIGAVRKLFEERCGIAANDLMPQLYALEDRAAIAHVFSVVASLDSPVIGEPQVTGQVKESHRAATAAGMNGPELDALLSAAYGAAKRVRTETTIGERPVSMAAAALQLARDIHGELDRRTALLVLGEEMGELIADYLVSGGLDRMTVISQVPLRAETASRRFGGHHARIDQLGELIKKADVVITSLGRGSFIISEELIREALHERRRHPIFLIDAAVPRDIEPQVNDLDGAFLYDLDDLERIAAAGRAGRDAVAVEARSIIEDEVDSYVRRCASQGVGRALLDLRTHFEEIRASVIDESGGRDVDEVTRRLINRLLHEPSRNLSELGAEGSGAEAESLLRRLFRLEGTTRRSSED